MTESGLSVGFKRTRSLTTTFRKVTGLTLATSIEVSGPSPDKIERCSPTPRHPVGAAKLSAKGGPGRSSPSQQLSAIRANRAQDASFHSGIPVAWPAKRGGADRGRTALSSDPQALRKARNSALGPEPARRSPHICAAGAN